MDAKPMAAPPHPDLLDHDSYSDSASDDAHEGLEGLEGGEGHLGEPITQPQRRKGGRKPIYSTVEERKQRNRQAQAAFRERRTEYIKQLEVTLKEKEDQLQSLQDESNANQSQCSSLRYTISVMEGIMIEHGIDVESEMRARGGSRGRISSGASISPLVSSHGNSAVQLSPESQYGSGSGIMSKGKPLKAKIAQLNGNTIPPKLEASHMPTPPWQNAPSPHAMASAQADERHQQDQLYARRASAYDQHQRAASGSGLVHGSLASPPDPAYAVTHGQPFPQTGMESEARTHMGGVGYGQPPANYANPSSLNNLGKLPPSYDPFYTKELCPS